MRTVSRLLLALLVLGACHEPLPNPAPLRQFTPATEFLVKETTLVNGAVSVHVEIPLGLTGPKPTVIALIGNTQQLVGSGFVAVTYSINWALLKGPPRSPLPGEKTVGKWVLASPSVDVLGERYLRDISATATQYVPAVIDWLETVPDVDATRLAMVGGSTNGFITLQAVAADRRIRAAVAITACGDYHTFLRDSSMGMARQPLALDPSYERWIRSQEIIEHPRRVVHAALLMLDNVGDELIPISCADETARVLTRAYARARVPQRFRYVRSQQSGHGIGPEEVRETLAWLQTWLQDNHGEQ